MERPTVPVAYHQEQVFVFHLRIVAVSFCLWGEGNSNDELPEQPSQPLRNETLLKLANIVGMEVQ